MLYLFTAYQLRQHTRAGLKPVQIAVRTDERQQVASVEIVNRL